MGIFDFLKKSKEGTTETGMDLPPIPKIEETGFPEIKEDKTPPLPETSLPPLPSDLPGELPPAPEIKEIKTPKVEMPETPKVEAAEEKIEATLEKEIPDAPAIEEAMPKKKEFEETPKPEFPEMPERVSEDVVPDKIPPLEGLPEAPEFKTEETAKPRPEPDAPLVTDQPRPVAAPETPPTYTAVEEPEVPARKPMRGPLYIRTDRFKQVLEDIELIKAKFKEEDDIFFRIADIKGSQDQKFEDFRKSLEDIQRKLLFIDKSLFEAK